MVPTVVFVRGGARVLDWLARLVREGDVYNHLGSP